MSDVVDYHDDNLDYGVGKTIIGCTESLNILIEERFTNDIEDVSPLINDILGLVENDVALYPHETQVLRNVNIVVPLPGFESKEFCWVVRTLMDYENVYSSVTVGINLFSVEDIIELGKGCLEME